MNEALAYTGSAIVLAWGIGHLVPTRSVVAGFGALGSDQRRILTMEWIAEGLTLCFLGTLAALVALAGGLGHPLGRLVLRAEAAMLLVMAGVTAATGARTSIGPIKACPVVKSVVAVLLVAAAGLR